MEQPNLEDPPHDNLCLSVLTSNGETITFIMKLKPGDTIEDILKMIQRHGGIPVDDKFLFYRGRKLNPEFVVASYIHENNIDLHLVDANLKVEQPVAWYKIMFSVLQIERLLEGDDGNGLRVKLVQDYLTSFLDMTLNLNSISDKILISRLSIFQYICAPALVVLYLSQNQSNKEVAEEAIKMFVSSCNPRLHFVCSPMLLELCTMLGKSGSKDDPLYTICRSTLGLLVEDMWIGTDQTRMDGRCVVGLKDIFPFVTELADKLSSPSEVHTFAAFLRPIKAIIKRIGDSEGSTPITVAYVDSCTHKEVGRLHEIFLKLVDKMRNCLEVVKNEMEMMNKEDSEWDQYLVILKEVHGIATLYESAENLFWSNIKSVDVSLRYLIVTYAARGEDYGWIIRQKDFLDFECRRHLVMLVIPDVNDENAVPYELTVRRSELLYDSKFYILQEPAYLRGELSVQFQNEVATGHAVLREWFVLVCHGIFGTIFIPCPNDGRKFFPNPASTVDPKNFKFAGRIIALALMHSIPVGIMFDRTFLLQLAGIDVSLEDIKDADPDLYRSYKYILDMDTVTVDQGVLGLTFVHEFKESGLMKVVELVANGKNTNVNSANRHEYVQLLVKHRFMTSVEKQTAKFAKGFTDILGHKRTRELVFKILEFEDINSMLHGSESDISVEDWKAHVEYYGYTESDPQIGWFWTAVEEMNGVERQILLNFWTAILYLPAGGFGRLDSKLEICKTYNDIDHLPSSNACFNRLNFPSYPSLEQAVSKGRGALLK